MNPAEGHWDRIVHERAAGGEEQHYAAQREVMDHLLIAVATSHWHNHTVLRGSSTLKAWFGEMAREPEDLDFVVVPERWRSSDVPAERMCEDLVARAAESAAATGTVRIQDRIGFAEATRRYPYRGTPGLRVEVDWDADHGGKGTLTVDFAFGETLPTPPIRTAIPRRGSEGPPITVPTADQASSLLWKLTWLAAETTDDAEARGKDLFDAVLLAEHLASTPKVLREVVFPHYRHRPESFRDYLTRLALIARYVDWQGFAEDYPLLESAHEEFADRLIRALAPTFDLGEPV